MAGSIPSFSVPFLLTRLLRGATCPQGEPRSDTAFLLTRLLRGATCFAWHRTGFRKISTHAPLARRDVSGDADLIAKNIFLLTRLLRGATDFLGYVHYHRYFYSRASCEARPNVGKHSASLGAFLLTRLLRGATSPLPPVNCGC